MRAGKSHGPKISCHTGGLAHRFGKWRRPLLGKSGWKFPWAGVLGKSACQVACDVAGWAGLGSVLQKGAGWGAWKKCLEILIGGVLAKSACEVACDVARWAGIGAWKRGWVGSLEKVPGNFDARGCLGKALARLQGRLAVGLGWYRCSEKMLGGELPKSAWTSGWGRALGTSACESICERCRNTPDQMYILS